MLELRKTPTLDDVLNFEPRQTRVAVPKPRAYEPEDPEITTAIMRLRRNSRRRDIVAWIVRWLC